MSFRRANKLVRGMMRGARRDTLLLFVVVALVVLFMTASSIFLASLERSDSEKREALYGGWQTMWYGADGETLSAVSSAEKNTVAAEFVADGSDRGVVVAADEDWLAMGAIKLQSGEFPTAAGEIALVASPETDGVAIGDRITVEYDFNHVLQLASDDAYDVRASLPEVLDYITIDDARLEKMAHLWDGSVIESAEPIWVQTDEDGEVIDEGGLVMYCVVFYDKNGKRTDTIYTTYKPYTSEEFYAMSEDEQREWVYNYEFGISGQFFHGWGSFSEFQVTINPRRAWENLGYEDVRLRLDSECSVYTLRGEGYGEDVGTQHLSDEHYILLKAWREYTVTGIVEPYAELWDSGGLALPDAFVAPPEAEHLRDALKAAEERGAAAREPQYILLSRDVYSTAADIYDRLLGTYTNGGEGRYGFVSNERLSGQKSYLRGEVYGLDDDGRSIYFSFVGEYGNNVSAVVFIQNYRDMESIRTTLRDIRNGRLDIPGFHPVPQPDLCADEAYRFQPENACFRLNTYAYPIAGSTATGAMGRLMSVGIYAVAFFAIFQIYLAQSRRRGRRSSVMKSIGATGGQIFIINMLEGAYIVLAALPVGVALGCGAAWLACRYGGEMELFVGPRSLALGLCGCVGSVAAGMLLTGAFGARPATGRDRPQRERRPRAASRHRSLFARMLRVTGLKKMAALVLLIALFGASLLASVFLGNSSYAKYRREVESVGAPDYALTLPYALHRRYVADTIDSLEQSDGIERALLFPVGENILIECGEDGLPQAVGAELSTMSDADAEYTGLSVDLVAVDFEDEDMVAALRRSLASGGLDDLSALAAGKACILVQPLVTKNGERSTAPQDAYFGSAGNAYAVGDTLHLVAMNKRHVDAMVSVSFSERDVAVAGVMNTSDIYPFSGMTDAVTIVGSDELLRALYPLSCRRMSAEQVEVYESYEMRLVGDSYGRTRIYAYSDGSGAPGDISVYRTARSIGAGVTNSRSTNEKLYAEAQNGMIMIVALCAMIAAIVYAIYANIASSTVEGESHHIGVLHAVGAPRGRQVLCYALMAALASALAAVCAHLMFCAVAVVTTLVQTGGQLSLEYFADVSMKNYPWAVHAALAGAVFVICVAAYTASARKVCRRTPLDNIRS